MKIVSGKQFCKIHERHGWTLKRTTEQPLHLHQARQSLYYFGTVHGNTDLKKGLQADLMKQAGLTADDM